MIERVFLSVLFFAAVAGCASATPTRKAPQAKSTVVVPAKHTEKAASQDSSRSRPQTKPAAIRALARTEPERPEDTLDTLRDLVTKTQQANAKSDQDALKLRANDMVQSRLNEDQLKKVGGNSDFGFLRSQAYFRLGEISLNQNDFLTAKSLFEDAIDYSTDSDLSVRAKEIISQIDASQAVSPQTIGAILPLTGKNAQIGQRALRGLEMGLGINQSGSNFKLAVMDSEGNPDLARKGVERLVTEDHVIAIVGSLLSKTAPAVASKSQDYGVPSIALSQRSGITEAGPNVFRNSLTSGMQVRALVRTAMEDLGMKSFAILYPNDPYGVEFANIFWDEVLARGGKISAVQTYSTKETDFRLVIQRLVGTFYGEARQQEFGVRLREAQQADKKRSVRNSGLETILPPVLDFDGVFIPDSARALGQIAAMLSYNDVRNVRLLGTNLWNTKEVSKRAGNFVNNLLFVDAITPANANASFVNEYRALYGEVPTLIEVQAYDAGLVLRQLITSGVSTREALSKRLLELKGFPGALGKLNVNAEREFERPVTSLTVENGEIAPIKLNR